MNMMNMSASEVRELITEIHTHTPHCSLVAHLYNDYTIYNTIPLLNISTQEATTLIESNKLHKYNYRLLSHGRYKGPKLNLNIYGMDV